MSGPDLLIPAIIAFVLMAIGLALTIREFRQLEPRREAERAARRASELEAQVK